MSADRASDPMKLRSPRCTAGAARLLLEFLDDPIDHDGQQTSRTAQEQRDACFLAHDVPPIGLSDIRLGRRIRAPQRLVAVRALAQTQELSKTSAVELGKTDG